MSVGVIRAMPCMIRAHLASISGPRNRFCRAISRQKATASGLSGSIRRSWARSPRAKFSEAMRPASVTALDAQEVSALAKSSEVGVGLGFVCLGGCHAVTLRRLRR